MVRPERSFRRRLATNRPGAPQLASAKTTLCEIRRSIDTSGKIVVAAAIRRSWSATSALAPSQACRWPRSWHSDSASSAAASVSAKGSSSRRRGPGQAGKDCVRGLLRHHAIEDASPVDTEYVSDQGFVP